MCNHDDLFTVRLDGLDQDLFGITLGRKPMSGMYSAEAKAGLSADLVWMSWSMARMCSEMSVERQSNSPSETSFLTALIIVVVIVVVVVATIIR